MKKSVFLAAFSVMLAGALLSTAPATLLDAGLQSASAGQLRLVSAQGSIWSGHGRLEIRNSDGAAVYSMPLQWEVNKPRLLIGQLSIAYQLTQQALPTQVLMNLFSATVTDLDVDIPASALEAALPATKGYGLGGTLNLNSKRLRFTRDNTEGEFMLRWQHASSTLAPVSPLGSFQLQLVGEAGQLQFSALLATLQGPLQLEGAGTISANQQSAMQVTATLPESHYAELAPFMRLIGVETAGNRFVLDL
ncbi:MAG: type II secretion system protein N [Pseudohongiella sp.]|nr:type II secretion system protein N [Pseudohongiella sp.]